MKINSNLSANGVNNAWPSEQVKRSGSPVASSVSLTGSSALNAALAAVPDARPEAVDRAKQLINDPSYPSPDVIKKLSTFFAQNLSSPSAE